MDLPLQAETGPTHSAGRREISAKNQLRRVAAAMERSHWRDEPGRAAAFPRLSSECIQPALSRVTWARKTRPDGPVASFRSIGRRPPRPGDARYLLHSELVTLVGYLHTGPHCPGGSVPPWRLLTARGWRPAK